MLFCFWSFHSAKVGLLCSHVWLGHLLAQTNDSNWESGLRFRVTDRLTGMWGMWQGGTRLLCGPPYQLAAYCNWHLPSCLSLLFSQSEKKATPHFKTGLSNNRFVSRCAVMWLVCCIPVLFVVVFCLLWATYRVLKKHLTVKIISLLSEASKLHFKDDYLLSPDLGGFSSSVKWWWFVPLSHSFGTDRCALSYKEWWAKCYCCTAGIRFSLCTVWDKGSGRIQKNYRVTEFPSNNPCCAPFGITSSINQVFDVVGLT